MLKSSMLKLFVDILFYLSLILIGYGIGKLNFLIIATSIALVFLIYFDKDLSEAMEDTYDNKD